MTTKTKIPYGIKSSFYRKGRVALFLFYSASCGVFTGNPGDKPGTDSGQTPPKNTSSSVTVDPDTAGSISFSLTDAPVDNIDAINIMISNVAIKADNDDDDQSGWINIPITNSEWINLLELQNGLTTELAFLDQLGPGTYSQIRLILDSNNPPFAIDQSDNSIEVKIPSGNQSGIKLKTSFEVITDETTDIVVDFDLRKSLKSVAGGARLQMKPVLRSIDNKKAKKLQLDVDYENDTVACLYGAEQTPDSDNQCDSSVTSATVKNGRVVFAFIEPATYQIRYFIPDGSIVDSEPVLVSP